MNSLLIVQSFRIKGSYYYAQSQQYTIKNKGEIEVNRKSNPLIIGRQWKWVDASHHHWSNGPVL